MSTIGVSTFHSIGRALQITSVKIIPLARVWIVAVIRSLSRWKQHPRVSRLPLTAILIIFVKSLDSVFAYLCLLLLLHDASLAIGKPLFVSPLWAFSRP